MVAGLVCTFLVGGAALAPVALANHNDDAPAKQETSNDDPKNSGKPTDDKSKTTPAEAAAKTYSYTAQAGDSYTLMARKALQTYGILNKLTLSQAQIVYAETLMAQEAGSPQLVAGQKVTFDSAKIKTWADKAKAVTGPAEAAWQQYVQYVDFNTNNVGE